MKNLSKNRLFSFFIPFIFMFAFHGTSAYHAEEIRVIPSGEAVGIKLYTDGLLVIGTGKAVSDSGAASYPAAECGIKINDIITEANGIELKTTEQLAQIVENNSLGLKLSIKRGNDTFDTYAKPVISGDGKARLGLWVRDSAAGIGTITYINPSDSSFAALGHGICDVDTGNILTAKSGNILKCSVLSVIKSEKGAPGELNGAFSDSEIGTIAKNTPTGVFGNINPDFIQSADNALPLADASQIREGDAYILSDIDGNGAKPYTVKIIKISEKHSNRGLVFEVTDNTLKEKTGGIVQGMSGAPIIQDNHLIGAVTHVFVNNPQKGYGIFAETMINSAVK